jgi:hemerythrin-like domain-containing protein
MKIIDRETGKREGKNLEKTSSEKIKLNEVDPIIRNAEKGEFNEYSPMDPPDAYDKDRAIGVNYDDLHVSLQALYDEHKTAVNICADFEKALNSFKEGGYCITKEINDDFNTFFVYFDEEIIPHNKKEEKGLFLALHRRMLDSGEHSEGESPHTPIDLMEQDHIKLLQLATLTFNFLGLAMRLKTPESAAVTLDLAYNKGKELAELLQLHIYRENNIIFPIAQKILTEEELNQFYG